MRRKPVPQLWGNMILTAAFTAFFMTVQGEEIVPRVEKQEPAYRVPVDLVWHQDRVFVANSKTGTLSRIDASSKSVTAEWKVAESLSGLAVWNDLLLLLDDHLHQLVLARQESPSPDLKTVQTLPVPRYPVDVAVCPDEKVIAVSSLWSRTLTLFSAANDELHEFRNIELSFAPRRLLFLPDGKLVVADSFGGHLAVVDSSSGQVIGQHDVYGHNIRGLGWNPRTDKLLVACQTLDPSTFTTYERVFWGVLMQNGLHSIPLPELLSETSESGDSVPDESDYGVTSYASSDASQQRYPLGTPSIGSGDPGAMVVTNNDTTLLLVSGVNQVAFRTASHLPFERLKTGRRPEAICLDDAEQQVFIANRFEDSVTVISLAGEMPVVESTISLGEVRTLSLAERGEQTFYDAAVSLDGWFSCHSCHTDGHTNGLRADTFGDENRGAPKKIVSLLGTEQSGPWGWNGGKSKLEEQIRTSLIISMQTQIPSEELPIDSLAAYLRSFTPAPSLQSARLRSPFKEELVLATRHFEAAGCRSCHAGDALTSSEAFDVGIHDELGETAFNPPSLRGVSQRAPYFHDGRAASLEDVLRSSHHNPETPLSEEQIRELTLLLESF